VSVVAKSVVVELRARNVQHAENGSAAKNDWTKIRQSSPSLAGRQQKVKTTAPLPAEGKTFAP